MAPRLAAPAAQIAARSTAVGARSGLGLLLIALLLACGALSAWATTAPTTTSVTPAVSGNGTASEATPAGIDPDWLSGAKAWILAYEYQFKPRGTGRVSAPNRALGLRTFVMPNGVEFEPRVPSKQGFALRLSIASAVSDCTVKCSTSMKASHSVFVNCENRSLGKGRFSLRCAISGLQYIGQGGGSLP